MRKKYWEIAEDRVTKSGGAKATPRSGAGIIRKGDCYTDTVMTETKSSQRSGKDGPYIIVSSDWFSKAKMQAQRQGLAPEIALVLGANAANIFRYRYTPGEDAPFNSVIITSTKNLTLKELLYGDIQALIVGKEVWTAYDQSN